MAVPKGKVTETKESTGLLIAKLKGEHIGQHSVYIGNKTVVFVDGVAEVSKEILAELEVEGLV